MWEAMAVRQRGSDCRGRGFGDKWGAGRIWGAGRCGGAVELCGCSVGLGMHRGLQGRLVGAV